MGMVDTGRPAAYTAVVAALITLSLAFWPVSARAQAEPADHAPPKDASAYLKPAVAELVQEGMMPALVTVGGQLRAVEQGAGTSPLRMTSADAHWALQCYAESLSEQPLECPDGKPAADQVRGLLGDRNEGLETLAVIGMSTTGKGKSTRERLKSRLPRFLMAASARNCPETQQAWARRRKDAPKAAAGGKAGASAESELARNILCAGAAAVLSGRASSQ